MKLNKQIFYFIVSGILFFGLGFFAGHWKKSDRFSPETIFATFDGGVVTAKEVNDVLQNELELFNVTRLKAQLKVTEEKVREKILEFEAEKKHLSLPELVRQYQELHQNDNVTNQDLIAYVQAQGIEFENLSESQREIFVKQIKNTKLIRAQDQLADDLCRTYNVHFNPELILSSKN